MPKNVPDVGYDEQSNGVGGNAPDTEFEKNVDALYRTYRENHRELLGYAYSMVGSTEAAQDIVQQAFTNTLSAIEGGSHIKTMGGFIYRCVRNLSISHIAREPENPLLEDAPLLIEQSVAAVAEDRGRWQSVQKTLDNLPAAQRSAFILAEVRGFHYDEIADALGRSTSAVRQLLNRARGKVRARGNYKSDLAGTPVTALGTDRALESWPSSLRSNIGGWTQAKASELQSFLGGLTQACSDSLLQSSCSLAVGFAIFALSFASPATPIQQDVAQADSGIPVATAPSIIRPHSNSTAVRIDELEPKNTLTAPRRSDGDDLLGIDTRHNATTGKDRTVGLVEDGDKPTAKKAASIPGNGQGPGSMSGGGGGGVVVPVGCTDVSEGPGKSIESATERRAPGAHGGKCSGNESPPSDNNPPVSDMFRKSPNYGFRTSVVVCINSSEEGESICGTGPVGDSGSSTGGGTALPGGGGDDDESGDADEGESDSDPEDAGDENPGSGGGDKSNGLDATFTAN